MIQPSMTIETVHGLRETVVLDKFVVGPTSSKTEDDSQRPSRDGDSKETTARNEE